MVVGAAASSTEDTKSITVTETSAKRISKKSSEMGGYIIDPIPQFCDNDKKVVIESWHFVSDHISEVRKNIFMFVAFIEINIVVNKTFIGLLNVHHYFLNCRM